MDILQSATQDISGDVNVLGCAALVQMAAGHGHALSAVSKQLVAYAMPLLTHRLQKARLCPSLSLPRLWSG